MKMLKITCTTLLIFLILYILFVLIAPPIVIKSKNMYITSKPYKASTQAKEIIANHTFIGDMHCDALLWKRNLNKKSELGHVDFPRMQEVNAAFQTFTIVTKSPKGQNFDHNSGETFDMLIPLSIGQGQPPKTWFNLLERCLYQCKKLYKFAEKSDTEFIVVTNQAELTKLTNRGNKQVIGGMLGVEGGHCLEGNIENFKTIYDAGVRMLGPLHFFDNKLGGSAHGIDKGGLTEFGFEVMKEMEKRSMIMDVAHSSDAVIEDILNNYNGPIVSSHTGARGMVNSGRNLTDSQLKRIADKGGIIGVGFLPSSPIPPHYHLTSLSDHLIDAFESAFVVWVWDSCICARL